MSSRETSHGSPLLDLPKDICLTASHVIPFAERRRPFAVACKVVRVNQSADASFLRYPCPILLEHLEPFAFISNGYMYQI